MAQSPSNKCRECSKLSVEEARLKLCWGKEKIGDEKPSDDIEDQRCHVRRSRYRNRTEQNNSRKRKRRIEAGLIELPPDPVPFAILYVYRETKESAVHAWYVEVWQSQKIAAYTEPEHALGMTEKRLINRAMTVLDHASQRCNQKIECFRKVVEIHPRQCPIERCPLKPEAERDYSKAIKIELQPV